MPADPWQVRSEDHPHGQPLRARLAHLLDYALLAPSGHNAQPWLFRLRDDSVELLADRLRCLPVVDPQDRALVISCGAALGNLAIAMRRFGLAPEIRRLPDPRYPDLLAEVGVAGRYEPHTAEVALCEALPRRRTTRRPFGPQPLPDSLVREAIAACAAQGVELAVVVADDRRSMIAALVAEGDRVQMADPRFRRELAAWIHSRRAASRDGISFSALGGADLLSFAGAAVVRTFDLGNGQAARDLDLALHSPALALLCTPGDTPADWLACGEALAELLATLTAAGFTGAYLNQPIEVDALRPRLRDAAGVAGMPQLLLRLGRGPAVPPSARRPLSEVLIA